MRTENDIPKSRCPLCGYRADAALSPHKTAPSAGDIALCLGCTTALVFGEDLRLREMTPKEFTGLHPEERDEIELIQRKMRKLDRRNLKGHHLR